MINEIKVQCDTKLHIDIENLLEFQGELKSLSELNYEKLKKQILEEGFSAPIFVWKNDGKFYILDGHQRVRTCEKLKASGYKVPPLPAVEIFAKTKLQAKKKLLSYVSQFGKVESQGLYQFIMDAEIDIADMEDFEIPEIDMEAFKEEFFQDPPPEGAGNEDNIPEVAQNEMGVKLGDIYQLGEHRLMCGDSTDLATVEKLMNGEKADMVFTDPPYELETQGGGLLKESSAMKKIKALGIDKFDPSTLTKHADTSVYCCNKPLISKYITLAEKWGVSWDLCVYHKQNITPNYGGHLMTDLEYLLVIGKQSPRTGIGEDKELYSKLYSGGKDADNETAWSKPVALCEKFIKLYSTKLVLDLFLGSGSTLIACEKTNRKCYGMELDPHYCSVIIKRWEEYSGKKHKKLTSSSAAPSTKAPLEQSI